MHFTWRLVPDSSVKQSNGIHSGGIPYARITCIYAVYIMVLGEQADSLFSIRVNYDAPYVYKNQPNGLPVTGGIPQVSEE